MASSDSATSLAPGRSSVGAPSFAILILLSGISPLATDMYLPALPALGRVLHASASMTQLTLTSFLIGFAVGQIVLGPISDATGRRLFLIAGPAAFVATSLACAVAPNAPVLVAARLAQGFVGAAGMVCARAVVSDYYRGDEAARRFGLLSAISLLGPILAPAMGAGLLQLGSWRLVFYVLAIVGGIQLFGVFAGVPETLPPEHRHPGALAPTLARMSDLLRDRRFMAHVTVATLATMGFFSYIGGSSFVLEHIYGISSGMYGLVFATNATGMAALSLVFSRLVGRFTLVSLRFAGLVAASSGSFVLLVVGGLVTKPPLAVVWVGLFVVTAGMGLVLPSSIALSQSAGARARGTAAALSGGISFAFGALVTPITGLFGGTSLLIMTVVMAAFMAPAFIGSRFAPE
jgi:DHA1 family bicyclomycin/chloramphenicol resistance-like MFS transporter